MKIRNKKSGQVLEFSRRYARVRRMQRRVFAWANTLRPFLEKRGQGFRLVMVRLSYAPEFTWKPNDIRDFMKLVKRKLGSSLIAAAFVGELQRRGEVHYHVLLLVRQGTEIPKPDEAGWWKWGSTRIETARSVYYICSYVSKEYQKMGIFPKGLRMFSVWINKEYLSDIERWFFHLTALPVWLRDEMMHRFELYLKKVRRVCGGGWECEGILFTSPWEVIEIG